MFTSNYKQLAKIVAPLQPISISRGKPRWMKGGWLAHVQPGTTGRNYDALAPTWVALNGHENDYHRAFAKVLRGLDPATVFAGLGENAVLLCFCERGRMCHRRIVAEWLEASLGVIVPELGEARLDTPMYADSTYDFWLSRLDKRDRLEKQLATVPTSEAAPAGAPVKSPGDAKNSATQDSTPAAAARPPGSTGRQTWNAKTRRWEAAK